MTCKVINDQVNANYSAKLILMEILSVVSTVVRGKY